ncbi:hypothetical protein [Salinispora arenicola]|nr:hypothetical protein [Salinispora arenicola]
MGADDASIAGYRAVPTDGRGIRSTISLGHVTLLVVVSSRRE